VVVNQSGEQFLQRMRFRDHGLGSSPLLKHVTTTRDVSS
jgi:hypothetical protein